MTDFRQLCLRMADELDHYRQLLTDDRREVHLLAAEARAALAAPTPPAGGAAMSDRLPPKVGHIFQLAAIICDAITEADTKITDPTTLAQKILSDPRSQWAPAREDRDHD